jgi:hypothetical protein
MFLLNPESDPWHKRGWTPTASINAGHWTRRVGVGNGSTSTHDKQIGACHLMQGGQRWRGNVHHDVRHGRHR